MTPPEAKASMTDSPRAQVLLTGASGFVGSQLWPALEKAGHTVRGMTRNPEGARAEHPEREWVAGDVSDEPALEHALSGCQYAYYLVHGMAEGGADFRQREVESARRFAKAAAAVGVSRIVYLGGFQPAGSPSEHLQSRLEVGEALRAGSVPCVELRASMIIGRGSLSWLIVRDLAARLPVMILPRWLKSRTEPVAVEDVIVALVAALEVPLTASASWDLPGPEVMTGKQVLEATATAFGRPHPRTIHVPVLSPWLSSHWVRFVTRAEWSVAREIVLGLAHDFLSRDATYWSIIRHRALVPYSEAAARAIAAESQDPPAAGFWGAVERKLLRGHVPAPTGRRVV